MSWHAIDSVDEAIEETRSFLSPFAIGRWLKLALISIFVGTGGSGLGLLNLPSSVPGDDPTGNMSAGGGNMTSGGNISTAPGGEFGPDGNVTAGAPPTGELPPPGELLEMAGAELGLIAVIALIVLGIGLVIGIITETLRFVFYDDLQTDTVRLVEPAKRRFGQALRLYGFKIGLQLLTVGPIAGLVAFLLLADVPIGPLVGVAAALVFLAVVLVSMIVSRITDEFVVPTMVVTDSGVLDGWRRFWPVLRGQLSQFGVYLVVHFLLLLAVGIARAILSVIVYGIVLVIGGVIGLVIVFGLFGGLSAAASSTAALVVLGLLGALTLLIGWVLLLPVQIAVLTYVTNYEVSMLAACDDDLRLRPQTDAIDDGGESAVVD
ncbi:DUF7544 domain-containing protein [Halonotius roseus]|uniref:Uncharacterized protein n=1 Tax=Halonotius roseus TaxID=2511997 RepID=A0A544QNB0_9EURY|nr:hypothetical protein [Halonotius roseus]TQQ80370.1 hypothetical protein EWF95_07720 [Halonotius roseus]